MRYIGAVSSIEFGFLDGRLSGFRIPVHRKVRDECRERIIAHQADEVIESKYSKENGLVWSQVTTASRLCWQATQELEVGHRTLEIQPGGNEDKADGRPILLSSILRLCFALDSLLRWEMEFVDISSVQSVDECNVRLEYNDNVVVAISASCPLRCRSSSEDGQLTTVAAFLDGKAQIDLKIISRPYFPLADTVVICRPSQLREAAVVLSCLSSDYLTPLIIADEPPMLEQEYVFMHEEFKGMHDKSMQNVVGLGPSQAEEKVQEALKTMRERWKIQESLTPYRSWVKRNEQFADILTQIALKKIVLLFDACDRDLVTVTPDGRSATSENEGPNITTLIPKGCSIICFLQDSVCSPKLSAELVVEHRYSTLSDLVNLAWNILQERPIPCGAIEVPEDDEEAYPLCLYDALRERIPLRPRQGLIHKTGPGWVRTREAEIHDDEGVLVELIGKARDLVGILYARFRGAKLLVRPAPQLVAVDRALSSINEEQLRAAQAYRHVEAYADRTEEMSKQYESEGVQARSAMQPAKIGDHIDYKDGRFINWIRRFIIGSDAIEILQSAVTAQIPEYVEKEIGKRKLTAFTVGLPYPFLKRGDCDWSEKAIGHVIDDPDLVVLREAFLLGAPRSIFGLSAIFDPGYFSTSETEDVLRCLDAHLTHPVVLSGEFASTAVLQFLAQSNCLDFLFFNTHGSENAVILDMPLNNYLVVQWLSFKRNPIVFNNSCLSWAGVGREFVRVGARGYVGTLWSVDSRDAATVAGTVMSRLVGNRMSVSESLCDIPVAPLTKKAYIFVGTCSVFMDDWADVSERYKKEYVATGVNVFSNLLRGAFAEYEQILRPVVKFFHSQLVEFEERLEKIYPGEVMEIFNGRLGELLVISREENPLEVSADYESKVISLCRNYLAKSDLDEEKKREFEILLLTMEAKIMRRRGKVLEAIDKLRVGSGKDAAENSDGSDLMELVDLYKQAGQFEKAIECGLRAKKLFEEDDDKTGILTVMGKLCQVYKRTGDLETGLELARAGFAMAAEIGEKRRQPTFKLDESNLLQRQGRLDEAIEAAKLASQLYRIYHQGEGDLRCHGAIGQCYLEKDDLGSARKWLEDGYEYARKIKDAIEIAGFAGDLGRLEALSGDISASAEYALEALGIYAEKGVFEAIPGVIRGMIIPYIGDYKLLGAMLCGLLSVLNRVEDAIAATVVPAICAALKSACQIEDGAHSEAVLNGLIIAFGFGGKVRAEREVTGHFHFTVDVFALFGNWLSGNVDSAVELARRLDSVSNGVLGLEELVRGQLGALALSNGRDPEVAGS